jgi:hypothetical protein
VLALQSTLLAMMPRPESGTGRLTAITTMVAAQHQSAVLQGSAITLNWHNLSTASLSAAQDRLMQASC